ncbi:hypothetical protein ACJIZ3_018207 [Penstemon smallii]|uniref:Uncharacterized protein n=1 Tax=Penstemon smallii TaxID=265156 RepID=A0ABD3SYH0_9LAMI
MAAEKDQLDASEEKLIEVKCCMQESEEDSNKELTILRRRVKMSATLLTYLKSKAQTMSVPHLAHTVPLNIDITSLSDEEDGVYISGLLKSAKMVTDVMETLAKRVIMAESETEIQKEKITVEKEELDKKAVQIEKMSVKIEEMKQLASEANCILNEVRQRVNDLVEETCTQRQRASENEEELCRVKQDFESMKTYLSTLLNVREKLVSSEKQFQTIERRFKRLVEKTSQLESEKMQKESEVKKLMEENVRLSALHDKKEAQLVAMNEQCKLMALNSSSNI